MILLLIPSDILVDAAAEVAAKAGKKEMVTLFVPGASTRSAGTLTNPGAER